MSQRQSTAPPHKLDGNNEVTRPADLPEFDNPPLNEVVLGIQFDPPKGYQQIYAGEVWKLYRKDFPHVQEQPALPPTFETFGPTRAASINFKIESGASHDRFWFISEDGSQLIQFQSDRILHNWRKTTTSNPNYPRFERICDGFMKEAMTLEAYLLSLGNPALVVRQCEVTYINHIPMSRSESHKIADWLSYLQFDREPDDLSCAFRQVIRSASGQPVGRLICEAVTAMDEKGGPFVRFSLTVRGVPDAPTVASAIEFLTKGREIIVRTFTDMTTESAHQAWRRVQ